MIQYLFTKPAETPGTLRGVEFIYQALLDAGVPHAEIPRLAPPGQSGHQTPRI